MVLQRLVEQDLELASQVQQAFLPDSPPSTTEYSFYQFYNPANQIGGDYFDYIPLEHDRIAIVVADVVGHGVAAAMFMAKLSAETRFAFASEDDPALAMKLLNDRLTALRLERFVTMLVLIVERATGKATIVNAGHMPPILRRASGETIEPGSETSGPPLAVFEGLEFEPFSFEIKAGDTLALYTDGIFEAPNALGEQYSINRIRKHLAQSEKTVEKIGRNLIQDVEKHIQGMMQEDDMCLVVFRKN